MFGKIFTTTRAAPPAPFEHVQTSQTKKKEGTKASALAKTLKKLKISITRPRSNEKRTQVRKETISGPIKLIPVYIPPPRRTTQPPRRTTQPPQDRSSSWLDKAVVSPAAFPLAPRARPQYQPKWTGGASSATVNRGSSIRLAAPRPILGTAPTTPSPAVSATQTSTFNLDPSVVTAARQLQVDVVSPTKVHLVTNLDPPPKPPVDDVKVHEERCAKRDERPGSWDGRYEPDMARQRYSVEINEDVEPLAEEEGNPGEAPDALLQVSQRPTTHQARHRSWDPTWDPVMDLFRYSMTSEDVLRLEHERWTKPWLQSQPPESPKPKRIFKWLRLGGSKKKEERARVQAQARRRRVQ